MSAKGFRLDLHVHTTRYSSCAEMSPEELLIRAKTAGLDGVVITEHGRNWPEADLAELGRRFDLVVLGGVEVTTTAGDVLVYGSCPDFTSIPTPDELVAAAPEAFLVAAHPFRGFLLFGFGGLDLEEAVSRPPFPQVHGVEVTNQKVTDQENDLAVRAADKLGLVKIGGSDAHTAADVGLSWTRFEQKVTTIDQLVAALKQGRLVAEADR